MSCKNEYGFLHSIQVIVCVCVHVYIYVEVGVCMCGGVCKYIHVCRDFMHGGDQGSICHSSGCLSTLFSETGFLWP